MALRPDIPAPLLACQPAPAPPDLGVPRWDRALADFLLDQGAAGEDCRAKLRAVGHILAVPGSGG